jgi:hypothetical protein
VAEALVDERKELGEIDRHATRKKQSVVAAHISVHLTKLLVKIIHFAPMNQLEKVAVVKLRVLSKR